MKRYLVSMLAVLASVGFAAATMDDVKFNFDIDETGSNTVERTVVLRGELYAVQIIRPTTYLGVTNTVASTSKVTIASEDLTLFVKDDIGASATYLPRAQFHTTAGVAATFVGGSNNTANAWYSMQPMAGPVTIKLEGKDGAAAGKTTRWQIRLIYKK
jgi:hypothetical protein